MADDMNQVPEMHLVPDDLDAMMDLIEDFEPELVTPIGKSRAECYRDHPSQAARAMPSKVRIPPRTA